MGPARLRRPRPRDPGLGAGPGHGTGGAPGLDRSPSFFWFPRATSTPANRLNRARAGERGHHLGGPLRDGDTRLRHMQIGLLPARPCPQRARPVRAELISRRLSTGELGAVTGPVLPDGGTKLLDTGPYGRERRERVAAQKPKPARSRTPWHGRTEEEAAPGQAPSEIPHR